MQALLAENPPLDRILGLRHQDPSEGVGQLAYAGKHSVGGEDFQQTELEASLLEVMFTSSSAAHEPILQPLLVPHSGIHRHCDLPAASLNVSVESPPHAFALH